LEVHVSSLSDVPLSVLDLAPVSEGQGVGEALRNSIDLARQAERLGYRRYWLAEHHNMPGIASSATVVLIGTVADATESIRVGSGGIMLPNHAPLVVAEQFGTLEALHPGRIDLGIGRAPGTDQRTALALRGPGGLTAENFPEQLMELLEYFERDPARGVNAVTAEGNKPPLWLLGSSGFSAQLAGRLGVPFSFAHHFASENTLPAVQLYRENFRPSEVLQEPYVMLGVAVIAAETDERAQFLAGPSGLSFLSLRRGRAVPVHRVRPRVPRRPLRFDRDRLARDRPQGTRATTGRHRRRRADDHHAGLRARGPRAVLRTRGEPQELTVCTGDPGSA
jgi:luciferase family oxidoreductase group 1